MKGDHIKMKTKYNTIIRIILCFAILIGLNFTVGCGGGGGGSSSSSGGGGVKASLDRSDVQTGMKGVEGRVRQCGQGQTGTVTVKAVIGGTGRVISAVATGSFAGTPVGQCAARAVRSARFPKSQKNLTVRYPFKL